MATVAELLVTIGANIDSFKQGMQETQNSLTETATKFSNAGSVMTGAGKTLTLGVTAPLVAIGTVSLKAATDFESSFTDVIKTIEGTEEELQSLGQAFRDMSKEIPVSVDEINKVGAAAGQLGIETQNIEGFTKTMLELGVSTNLSSEQAATALARLANITGMPQTEFDKLGSTVVALGNNLATTEAEIVEMGLRLAGAGKQLGFTEADTLSFAGALSSVGIQAEAGGSAMSKVMIDIQKSVNAGGESLNTLARVSGMTADQFKKSFEQDAASAIATFIIGLGQMQAEGTQIVPILDDLGFSGLRTQDALLRLSGAGDLLTNSLDIGSKAWIENTALTDEAEKKFATTAAQMQIFHNRINDAAITLGGALMPALTIVMDKGIDPLISGIEKAVTWFSGLSEGTQQTIVTILALVAAIGPTLVILGTLAGSVSKLITLWQLIQPAAIAAGVAIGGISVPVLLIGAGIVALIAIGVLIIKNWDQIKAAASKTWNDISGSFTKASNSIKTTITGLISSVTSSMAKIPGIFSGVFEKALSYLKGLPSKLYNEAMRMGSSLWDGFKKALGIGSPSFIDLAFIEMIDSANEMVKGIKSAVPRFNAQAKKFAVPLIPSMSDITQASAGTGIGIGRMAPIQSQTGVERPRITFNQNIRTEARPEQIQRITERALRKIAMEWGVD